MLPAGSDGVLWWGLVRDLQFELMESTPGWPFYYCCYYYYFPTVQSCYRYSLNCPHDDGKFTQS